MNPSDSDVDLSIARQTMIRDARTFYNHGWLMGTSGNLSIRLDEAHFLITASGKDKGALTEEDFLICTLDGKPAHPTTLRPSAETLIHCKLYQYSDDIQAIYHTHDPFAALCGARDNAQESTTITDVEMIKGLGQWQEGASVSIPILPNYADLTRVADAVDDHLSSLNPDAFFAPCINLIRHGVYAWGDSAFAAKRHMESSAYLFHYSWQWGLWNK